MRGLLSAARRTGVLGHNASVAPAAASSALLPSRRVPSAGLGPPMAASLLEAQKAAAASSHRRRRPRRLPTRAAAAAAAAAGSPTPSSSSPSSSPPAPAPFSVPPAEVSFGDLTDQGVVANSTGLQLLFLGTGAGPAPTSGRGAPCVAVRTPHASWLFDCGDDSQRALVREVPVASEAEGETRGGGRGGGGGRNGSGAAASSSSSSPLSVSAPVRHGRISAFFVTSRFGGGALGLPGMLCISSASRVVKGAAPPADGGGGGGLPPTSVSVFGPPGIANFLNEMLALSDTYLAMPVMVHEFGYGCSNTGSGGLASMVAPSQRGSGSGNGSGNGSGAVPVARLLSRRAKLSVATLLPDELNPFGFYDLQRAPKLGNDDFEQLARKGRTLDPNEADRVGFGFGFDARSGIREPDCLPPPGDPARAGPDGLLRDPAAATWTLRFDREFVVRCVPLIAPSSSPAPSTSDDDNQGGKGGGGGAAAAAGGAGAARASANGKAAPPTTPAPSAAPVAFASAPGPDALGYVIRESARAGRIDAELAVSLGVSRGPMMAELKAGRSVTVAVPRSAAARAEEEEEEEEEEEGWGALDGDGKKEAPPPPPPPPEKETRVVRPEDVVSPDRPGRVVAILGDPLPPRSDAETLLPPPPMSPNIEDDSGAAASAEAEEEEARAREAAALAAFSAVVAVARGADLFVAGAGAAAAAAEAADRAGASALVLTRFGKGDPTGGGSGSSGGDDGGGSESEGGYESGGGENEQQRQGQRRKSQRRRRRKRYDDEDLAAEAEAVLAARAAAPRLSGKVAAARDLDTVVLSRREPVLGGAGGDATKGGL